MTLETPLRPREATEVVRNPDALVRAGRFPRLRYMGSKYRLLRPLRDAFRSVGGATALDAFSGSGVVSYLLKCQGFAVTSNDFLNFPSIIARATVENSVETLDADLVDVICSPRADDRDFIRSTFGGIFLTPADLSFMDSAWSHIDRLDGHVRDIAISALVLSAARKQPRGVFTYVGSRYDDGRRDLSLTMEEHFRLRVADYNRTVFDTGREHRALTGDVAALDSTAHDLVYLDPPYAPPRDDADYMKRYHFLEGLSVYWRGQTIMPETKTRKIEKKFTPFAYKRTVEDALAQTFEQFETSGAIVMSYSSNALPGPERIVQLLKARKPHVEVEVLPHTYSFGTHSGALRTTADEYIFIGRD